jgi:hypothetical protein
VLVILAKIRNTYLNKGAEAPQTWRQQMFYYKAEATFIINGTEVTLTDIKASERNYSHAVITVSTVVSEFYAGTNEPNLNYGKKISYLTFHQGEENAIKASRSTHSTWGGQGYLDRKRNFKSHINPTADIRIVETTLVDAKTYREFKKGFINTDFQLRAGV